MHFSKKVVSIFARSEVFFQPSPSAIKKNNGGFLALKA